MKRFSKAILLFTSPLWLVIASYFVLDPFRVLYHYEDITKGSPVCLNKDYATAQMYLQQRASHHYDSFLFGSSRTLAYRLNDWKQHLPPGATPFILDGFEETLYGIDKKVLFLDRVGDSIKNALVIVCPEQTFSAYKNTDRHLTIKHPAFSGESWLTFHFICLKAYLSDLFFVKIIDYSLFHKMRPYLKKVLVGSSNQFDPATGERDMLIEARIQADPDNYYGRRQFFFYDRSKRDTSPLPRSIGPEHLAALKEIKTVFDRHGTHYELVISPLYDQRAIDPGDLATLREVFGAAHVHDYSGKNAITEDQRNYIERSHYRAHVGRRIMDEIYGDTLAMDTTGAGS